MRRLTLLSGSKLKLASYCTWWANPDVSQVDIGSEDARAVGSAFHKCAESRINGEDGVVAATIAFLPEKHASAVRTLYDAWENHYGGKMTFDWSPEVTYVFDVETRKVRLLGEGLERKYEEAGIKPTEIPVTVDALFYAGNDRFFVYDWKTGIQRDREPVAEHKQLRAGGFCAARAFALDAVTVVASYVDADGVREETATLDSFDFAMIEEELVALHAAAVSGAQPCPGPHCADMWCGAIAACPAVQKAREAVMSSEAASLAPTAIVTTNAAAIRSKDQAAQMYTMLGQVDALSKACWKALDAYVDANGGVALPDGKMYAAIEKSRDSIRLNDAAIELVRDRLGEYAQVAIKTTISKEAIADATKAKVGGGKPRVALEKEILNGLESLGAIHVSTFVSHEAIRPKKGEAA